MSREKPWPKHKFDPNLPAYPNACVRCGRVEDHENHQTEPTLFVTHDLEIDSSDRS